MRLLMKVEKRDSPQWVKARDPIKQPKMCSPKEYLIQNVSSYKIKRPYFKI